MKSAREFNNYSLTVSRNLPLEEIDRMPILSGVLKVWRTAAGTDGPPVDLDPLDLPRAALRHVMLVDLVEQPRDAVIRLAGTLPCELYGGELRGTSVKQFFDPEDAEKVLDDLFGVARSGTPTLTQRSYVSIRDRLWAYTRLLLPLRPDGRTCTRIMKLIEPGSFHTPSDAGSPSGVQTSTKSETL